VNERKDIMSLDQRLQEIVDGDDIRRCLHRYSRGVDRLDEELIRSAFHPDAIDNHGIVDGTVDDFLAHWLPLQSDREASQHYVSNITIEVTDDDAHVESYFLFVQKLHGQPELTMRGGRYVDRFERRDGSWKIAMRVVVSEWSMAADGSETTVRLAKLSRGRRDRSDPSYARPLQ
jgi:SnoaL-like domain